MSSQKVSGDQQERSILSGLESGLEFTRRNFDNPALRVAATVLGGPGNVLARARGSRRRYHQRGEQWANQPGCSSDRAGPDGIGRHPLHGSDLRGPPQSCSQHCVRYSWRFPVAARARLYHRPVGRSHPRLPAPEGDCSATRACSAPLSRVQGAMSGRRDYGVCLDGRPGEHDPGDGLQSAEPRADLGVRGGCIHHPRRDSGQARSVGRR